MFCDGVAVGTPTTATFLDATLATLGSERFDHKWQGDQGTTPFAKRLAWPPARAR